MIPCYVTMRDLLTWPRAMCLDLVRLGFEPILCDHGSTYPPLLRWYGDCGYEVRRYDNAGCYGFFRRGDDAKQDGFFAVTDCDLDLSRVPDDFRAVAIASFRANPWANKVGVSLEIVDVPRDSLSWDTVQEFEPKYWTTRTPDNHWRADIGATLAIYDYQRSKIMPVDSFYRAVRLDRPYTARHLPWHLTEGNLPEEYQHYLDGCDHLPVFTNAIKRKLSA